MTEPIKFNIVDWREYDEVVIEENEEEEENQNLDDKEYAIELYGRTGKNDPNFPDKTVYLKIKKYYPHFYLRLPDNFTQQKLNSLTDYIVDYLYPKKYKNSMLQFELVK
jgi:hypothetical protein